MKKTFTTFIMLLAVALSPTFLFAQEQVMELHPSYFKLTAGLNDEADQIHPEMVIEGNTIHLLWLEYKYGEGKVYYKHSDDLGRGWDTTQLLYTFASPDHYRDSFSRGLAVSGNTVHVLIPDYAYDEGGLSRMIYIRSTDNGMSFAQPQIWNLFAGYGGMGTSIIKVVDDQVAIAYTYGRWSGNTSGLSQLMFKYSDDGGQTFSEPTAIPELNLDFYTHLADMYFDGEQVIILHQWLSRWMNSRQEVYVSISNDLGKTFEMQKLSVERLNEDGETYRENMRVEDVGWQTFQPHIAKSGETIHIVFDERSSSYGTYYRPVYLRSTDNGKTFEPLHELLDMYYLGGVSPCATVVAKENYVYIMYRLNAYHSIGMSVSNDNGNTFTHSNYFGNMLTAFNQYDFPVFNMQFDPNDASGKTLHTFGRRKAYSKTIDGGASFWDLMEFSSYYFRAGNYDMMSDMRIDKDGNKHWIYTYKVISSTNPTSKYNLYYHRETPAPEPGATDRALQLSQDNGSYWLPQNDLQVPHSQSLDFQTEMTGEAWVKFNSFESRTTIGLFTKIKDNTEMWTYSNDLQGYGLFYKEEPGKVIVYAAMMNENDERAAAIATKYPITESKWHHLAFTYDGDLPEDNLKLYINGLLVDSKTLRGTINAGQKNLIVGPHNAARAYHLMDNLRLWDKALSQEEIESNMLRKDFAGEEHLKLYYTFDDTYKDLSGNGNDATYLFKSSFTDSNFEYTGIPAIANKEHIFSIYPNPTAGILNIGLPAGISGRMNIEIFDTAGQRIEHLVRNSDRRSLDMTGYKAGVYLIKIRIGDRVQTLKCYKL